MGLMNLRKEVTGGPRGNEDGADVVTSASTATNVSLLFH